MARSFPAQRIALMKGDKRALRAQFGALCWRRHGGKLQILLTTGRRSGKWIAPKGWPIHGATGPETALREAFEEAGVKGRISGPSLGAYIHVSRFGKRTEPRLIALYPVKVRALATEYNEKGQRRRKWFGAEKAALKVRNPELAVLIRNFEMSKSRQRAG